MQRILIVLAEKGFFDREWLFTLNDGGTKLPSHPDRLKTPGVDMTTGSLGQGTSAAGHRAAGRRAESGEHRPVSADFVPAADHL